MENIYKNGKYEVKLEKEYNEHKILVDPENENNYVVLGNSKSGNEFYLYYVNDNVDSTVGGTFKSENEAIIQASKLRPTYIPHDQIVINNCKRMINENLEDNSYSSTIFANISINMYLEEEYNSNNPEDAPKDVINTLEKYHQEKNIERTKKQYQSLISSIPEEYRTKYDKISALKYNDKRDDFNNWQDLDYAKKVANKIPEIENRLSKEPNKNQAYVLVYWSESGVFNTYKDHKEIPQVFTIDEMDKKYAKANAELEAYREKEHITGTYSKTKFSLIVNIGDEVVVTSPDRIDVGDGYQKDFTDFLNKSDYYKKILKDLEEARKNEETMKHNEETKTPMEKVVSYYQQVKGLSDDEIAIKLLNDLSPISPLETVEEMFSNDNDEEMVNDYLNDLISEENSEGEER